MQLQNEKYWILFATFIAQCIPNETSVNSDSNWDAA